MEINSEEITLENTEGLGDKGRVISPVVDSRHMAAIRHPLTPETLARLAQLRDAARCEISFYLQETESVNEAKHHRRCFNQDEADVIFISLHFSFFFS